MLGHEHRRRRRRQQLQVVASPHATCVLVVQLAPSLHLPERRAQDQPDPRTGVPAPSLGVGHGLPARRVQRPTEQGDRVLLVPAVRHDRRKAGDLLEERRAAPRTCPRSARSTGNPGPSRTRTPPPARRCQRPVSHPWLDPSPGTSRATRLSLGSQAVHRPFSRAASGRITCDLASVRHAPRGHQRRRSRRRCQAGALEPRGRPARRASMMLDPPAPWCFAGGAEDDRGGTVAGPLAGRERDAGARVADVAQPAGGRTPRAHALHQAPQRLPPRALDREAGPRPPPGHGA